MSFNTQILNNAKKLGELEAENKHLKEKIRQLEGRSIENKIKGIAFDRSRKMIEIKLKSQIPHHGYSKKEIIEILDK